MSGGGGDGGAYAPADTGVSCERLKFTAPLQSVQADAVAGLSVGDTLNVGLQDGEGPAVIEVRNEAGQLVGALIDRIIELLRCIQQGYEYVADIESIDGGDVRVTVHTP